MNYIASSSKVLSYDTPKPEDVEETKNLLSIVSKIEEQEIIDKHKNDSDFSNDKEFNILQYFLYTKRK